MTTATVGGIACAVAAAAAFECSFVLQALEARRAREVRRPHIVLLGRLARRPLWLLAILVSLLGFALQVLALRQAPLSVVQPILALGLVLLLLLGRAVLEETPGRREWLGVAGVITGVCIVVVAAPERGAGGDSAVLPVACVLLGLVLLAPFARRSVAPGPLIVAAAAGDALAALAINNVAGALGERPVAALAWAALAAAAGLLAVSQEATALQRSPVSVVAPGVLAGQVAVPVVLAPLVAGEGWGQTPGDGALLLVGLAVVVASATMLARSLVVAPLRKVAEPVP